MTKAIDWADSASSDSLAKASAYLGLLGVTQIALADPTELVKVMAKDLLRASGGLPGLPQSNVGVTKWLKRIKAGDTTPPCLLVQGSLPYNRPLVIAEGYHRVSACYLLDEQTEVAAFWLAVS